MNDFDLWHFNRKSFVLDLKYNYYYSRLFNSYDHCYTS